MIKEFKRNYVINQAMNAYIPEFPEDIKVRYHLTFSGRVQKVGFRLEIEKLAERLSLTGIIKNLENGNVDLEIQGQKNKILFLVNYMRKLVRIKITSIEKEEMDVIEDETEFIVA